MASEHKTHLSVSQDAATQLQVAAVIIERDRKVFPLYYGEGVWVVCEHDGSLLESFTNQFDADLNAELTNWLRSLKD